MLIRFESSQAGSFVMQESIAAALLGLLDRNPPEGAITDEDIPIALNRLEAELDRLAQINREDRANEDDEDETGQRDAPIDLHTRAAPLIEMLRRTDTKDGYVMWRPD